MKPVKFGEEECQKMLKIKSLQLPNFKPKVKRAKLTAPISTQTREIEDENKIEETEIDNQELK